MKILHVITSLRTGGAGKLVSELLPLLREQGAQVELALFDGTPSHILDSILQTGIQVHILGMGARSMYNPLHILQLRRLMKNFDIVHSHNTSAQLFTALAATSRNILVTTEHNTDNRRRHHGWLRPLDKALYRRYASIVCCSRAVGENLSAYLGPELAGHITVIENGIDLSRYSSHSDNKKAIDIVMVAAFRPQKDHITPLLALKLLPPEISLCFAGDGETRTQVEAEVKRLGLQTRVRFLGAVADVPALSQSSKIALLSTHYEGFGLVCVEAMASGTPLVASDVEAVREVCAEAAVLFPPGDYKALADILGQLLYNPSRRAEIAAACMVRASDFDIRRTAESYFSLYSYLYNRL